MAFTNLCPDRLDNNARSDRSVSVSRARRTERFAVSVCLQVYVPGRYVLLKPFRALVTVKVPSGCAVSLIQYAVPL